MTVKQLIQSLQESYTGDEHIAASLWVAEDIKECMGKCKLTKKQINEVLDHLGDYHDAVCGINWDVIEGTVEQLFPEKCRED